MTKKLKWIRAGILIIILYVGIPSIFQENNLLINSVKAQNKALNLSQEMITSGKIQSENQPIARVQSSMQDLWTEIYVNPSVIPGRTYTCRIKLWNMGASAIDSITIQFLAPNKEEVDLGYPNAMLYTKFRREIQRGGIVGASEIDSTHADFPGKLESIIWQIASFPANDSTEIEFELEVDRSIAGNTKLHNKFLFFVTKDGVRSLILSDVKVTGIRIVAEIDMRKFSNKDTVAAGETVDFRIQIWNNGRKDAENVVVTDVLPPELEFIEFLTPDDSDSQFFDQMNQSLTWTFNVLPRWEIDAASSEVKTATFRVRVREEIEIETLYKKITNVAKFKRGEIDSGFVSASSYIRSDPDFVGEITQIAIPVEWSHEDSIQINSIVKNIGGTNISDNFMCELSYYDLERAASEEVLIWEGWVNPNLDTLKALGENSFMIPTQSVIFDKGGFYRICLAVDTEQNVREWDETNNIICDTIQVRIPSKFYLDQNVFKPDIEEKLNIFVYTSFDGQVKINVYNVAGEFVKKIVDEFRNEGRYSSDSWDGRDKQGKIVSSGVYVVTLEAQNFHKTHKVIIIR